MHRRPLPMFAMTFLRVRRLYAYATFCAAICCAAPLWAQPKPNVIVILADDAGYADFGFMNQYTGETTEFKTPNIDALAGQGKVFTNAYMTASICSVSRAGLLTGRNPSRFNFEYNVVDGANQFNGVPGSEFTMAEAMKQAGYKTSIMGKWHLGFDTPQLPAAQGFDYFYGIKGGIRNYFGPGGTGPTIFRNTTNLPAWNSEPSFNNIPSDPTHGRMFTDAIADEATQYISQNSNQADPFFMYLPFTAPHSPYDKVKAADSAEFDSTSLVGYRKNVAALTLSMDRAVGLIMARLNDPNGDGNTIDSIANNTIVVFSSDHGGALPVTDPTLPTPNTTALHDNGPLRGYKGQGFEGGLRVPLIIKAPGVTAGTSNEAITSMDLMPTFLAAAGAAAPSNLDGRDLTAVLQGAQSGALHDAMYWRSGFYYFAIRKGDWKLVKGSEYEPATLYHLNPDGSGETLSMNNAEPALFRSMLNEFVDWEATLGKPQQRITGFINRFDVFRFNQNASTFSTWSSVVWQDHANPGSTVAINREDSYANAALVFMPRNDATYNAYNNIVRSTGHHDSIGPGPDGLKEFMLNELRFEGPYAGDVNRSGFLTGYPIMFAKSLSGAAPKIHLQTTSSTASFFSFNINMDIVLHADLEITGNGTQPLYINGQIRDFDEARSLTKSGTSLVRLAGNGAHYGDTIVTGGILSLESANSALTNTSKVQVGPAATVLLKTGSIRTPLLEIAPGGTFTFTGGSLSTSQVDGNLINTGGNFKPGLSVGAAAISGDYTQSATSTFTMELGGVTPGTQYDRVLVGDDVALAGALQVLLVNLGGGTFDPAVGDTFEIIRAADILSGTFSSVNVPTLTGGKKWAIQYSPQYASLAVVTGLSADFDHNNVVNSADLTIWRSWVGMNPQGDADLDGDTDGSDLLLWQRQLGLRLLPSSVAAAAAIPEPASALLLAVAVASARGLQGRRRRLRV